MKKAILLALLASGIMLLVFGVPAYASADSDVARFSTGSTTDRSLGMLFGGVLAVLIGAGGLLGGVKASRNS